MHRLVILTSALWLVLGSRAEDRAPARSIPELVKALRRRAAQLDHVRFQFDWLMCRAPLDKDPFSPENWLTTPDWAVRYRAAISIVRPHFRLDLSSRLPGEKDLARGWIDGQSVLRTLADDGTWHVIIDNNRWAITGPVPYLTIFEFTLFDFQQPLVEMLEQRPQQFNLRRTPQGTLVVEGRWEVARILAELDPLRGYVPVELRTRIDFRNRKHSYWTLRVQDTEPLAGTDIDIIKEAVFALDSSTGQGKWQIYHFKLRSADHDESLTKDDLRIEIPKKNLRLWNELTGYSLETDEEGRVVHEETLSRKELEQRQVALERTRQAIMEAAIEKERRASRTTHLMLIGSGGAGAALLAGVWWWMRRRHVSHAA